MISRRSSVVGVFADRCQAETAIDDLRRAGFTEDQIGFAMRGEAAPEGTVSATEPGAATASGAITGGILGGILGAVAAGLIPGVGPFIAGGILGVTLGGAAAGAAAGGLLGALSEMGLPEEEARFYQGEFEAGRIIVTVKADGRYDEAAAILRRTGAYDVDHPATAPTTPAGSTTALGTETSRSETGAADRFGDVSMGKRPMDAATAPLVRDPLSEMAAGAASEPHRQMDRPLSSGWMNVGPRYRQDWERRYGAGGRPWEEVEPSYRYGYEMAQDPRLQGREFRDVEAELRSGYRDWATRTGYTVREKDGGWERMRREVEEAWNRSRRGDAFDEEERRVA